MILWINRKYNKFWNIFVIIEFKLCLTEFMDYIAVLVVIYSISNTIVLEIL